jgi:CheY-like chemotaxis protein
MKGDRERLLAEGFDGYIAKPVDIKAVPRVLEQYLGGQPALPPSAPDSVPP